MSYCDGCATRDKHIDSLSAEVERQVEMNREIAQEMKAAEAEVERLRETMLVVRLERERADIATEDAVERIAALEAEVEQRGKEGYQRGLEDAAGYPFSDMTKHICDSGDCGLDPCEEMPVHREPAPKCGTCGEWGGEGVVPAHQDYTAKDDYWVPCPACQGGAS